MPNVFYLNPTNIICGGNKVVFEHCNNIASIYQKCFIISDDEVPEWIRVNAFFVNKKTAIKLMKPDDIIIFHWDSNVDIRYVLNAPAKNKFYLVQSFVYQNMLPFSLPFKYLAVSNHIKKHLNKEFNIDATLLLNAIDHDVFYERKGARVKGRVFAIDKGGMKGVDDVKKAETIVKKDFPDVEFVYKVNLLPEEIAEEYSKAEIFVSSSWYEGFGLPVLEAMACGAAVVCTDSKGIDDFAFNNENCLKVPPKSPEEIAKAIKMFLSNPEQVENFRKRGFDVVQRFKWEKTAKELARIFSLKDKLSDEQILANTGSIKVITRINGKTSKCFGSQAKYRNTRIQKIARIKGGGHILLWLTDWGYPIKCTVGDFDYFKLSIVDKVADVNEVINPNGKYICYVPEIS